MVRPERVLTASRSFCPAQELKVANKRMWLDERCGARMPPGKAHLSRNDRFTRSHGLRSRARVRWAHPSVAHRYFAYNVLAQPTRTQRGERPMHRAGIGGWRPDIYRLEAVKALAGLLPYHFSTQKA